MNLYLARVNIGIPVLLSDNFALGISTYNRAVSSEIRVQMESATRRKILKGVLALALPLLVSSCQSMPPEELCDRLWYQAKQTGSATEARTLFEQAIDQGRKSGNGAKLSTVTLDYGDYLLRDGDASGAAKQALAARQDLDAARNSPTFGSAENREREVMIARSQYLLAKAYTELGRLQEAKTEYEQALVLHDRVLGNMTRKLEMTRQYISLLKKMGKTSEASELEIKQQALYTTVDDCDRLIQEAAKALDSGDITAARKSLRIARLAAEKFGPSSNRFRDTLLHSAICEFVGGDMVKAKSLLEEALDPSKHPGNRTKRDLCREYVLLGFLYELEGNMVEANKLYEISADLFPGGPSATLYTVAGYLQKQHNNDLMIKVAKRAYAKCEEIPDSVPRKADTSAKLLRMIADGLRDTGQPDEAHKYYKKLLDKVAASPKSDAYLFRDCVLRLSDSYLTNNDVSADLDFLSKLAIPVRFTGKHALLIRTIVAQRQSADLAIINKLEEAEVKALDAIDLAKQTGDKNVICLSQLYLADIYKLQQRYEESEAQYKNVIKHGIDKDVKVFVFDGLMHLAEGYMRQKRFSEARDKFLEAWRIHRRFDDEQPSRPAYLALRIAESETYCGHFDESDRWVEIARREFKRVKGVDPTFGSICLYTSADNAALRKDFDRAFEIYKQDLSYCELHSGKLGPGMVENAIDRLIDLADKMFKLGMKQQSVDIVDVSLNAYVRDKIANPNSRARFQQWIGLARKEGFDKEAGRWARLLK